MRKIKSKLLHHFRGMGVQFNNRYVLYPKICPLILSKFPLTRLFELQTGLEFAQLKTSPCIDDLN